MQVPEISVPKSLDLIILLTELWSMALLRQKELKKVKFPFRLLIIALRTSGTWINTSHISMIVTGNQTWPEKNPKGSWPLVSVVKIQPKDDDDFEQNSGFRKNNHISCNTHFTQKILIIYINKSCQILHFIIIILNYKLNVCLRLLWFFVFIIK